MDIINIEIMDDGEIKVKTSDISEANHMSADELLELIDDMVGVTKSVEKVEHEFWKNRTGVRGGRVVKSNSRSPSTSVKL